MNAAIIRKEVDSALVDRFGHVFEQYERVPAEVLRSGIDEIDNGLQGFPRGGISEIHGAASSGRTSIMLSALAAATSQQEICALVDCSGTFDLSSAATVGIDFHRLLWIRCGHNLERAFKAVDLILHAGGFGLVALNLCDVPATTVRRIVSTWWFRFRRAIENTRTGLMILTPVAAVRSCAALAFEVKNEASVWRSTMSLVSENSNSSFTDRHESGHLSLVQPGHHVTRELNVSHAQCFQGTRVSVHRERPVHLQPASMAFSPQLR
jgi:hypothetical protein